MDVLTKVEVDLSTGKEQQSPLTTEQINSYNMRKNKWEAGAVDRAFVALRRERDNLLHDTDWWASSDLSITEEQTSYRQALRDLPANTADPANPTWPTKPGD